MQNRSRAFEKLVEAHYWFITSVLSFGMARYVAATFVAVALFVVIAYAHSHEDPHEKYTETANLR